MAPGRAKEMIGSGIFVLIALAAYIEAGNVQRLGYDALGESAFPRMIAAVVGLSALALFVQAFMLRKVPKQLDAGIAKSKLAQAVVAFALFTLFTLNVFNAWVPFPISGVIFCLGMGLIYIEEINRTSVIGIILMSALFPMTLDWIFRANFYVEMP